MDIYQTWKLYKQKIEQQILQFNKYTKQDNFQKMTKCKDNAKNYYLKFIKLLQTQKQHDRIAFKQVLDDFINDIKKMSQYIKNNQHNAKKILNNNSNSENDKQAIKNNLNGIIVKQKPNITWNDVAGLEKAKSALKQAVIMPMKFPQIFTGSRKPWKGILLYGPPGTGKTFIAKACANQMNDCTFFSVSSSDIMSKYVGQSQKIVKQLFSIARNQTSSIIFIDEVDSMTGNRSDGENQSSRRVKTQFLVQMDGVGKQGKLLVLGATNLPWELDPAIRRRFERRIYIPLPDYESRYYLIKKLLKDTPNSLTQQQYKDLAERTDGYSGSDISTLVKDASYQPLRISQKARKFRLTKNQKKQDAWLPVPPSENIAGQKYFEGKLNEINGKLVLPDLEYKNFIASLIKVKPSVDKKQLAKYQQFTEQFGQEG